jgi:hypothetical protein
MPEVGRYNRIDPILFNDFNYIDSNIYYNIFGYHSLEYFASNNLIILLYPELFSSYLYSSNNPILNYDHYSYISINNIIAKLKKLKDKIIHKYPIKKCGNPYKKDCDICRQCLVCYPMPMVEEGELTGGSVQCKQMEVCNASK